MCVKYKKEFALTNGPEKESRLSLTWRVDKRGQQFNKEKIVGAQRSVIRKNG